MLEKRNLFNYIYREISKLPKQWDILECYQEMYEKDYGNIRQDKFLSFYFEGKLREWNIPGIKTDGITISGTETKFDAYEESKEYIVDFKLSGNTTKQIILNDQISTICAIEKYNSVFSIILKGQKIKDFDVINKLKKIRLEKYDIKSKFEPVGYFIPTQLIGISLDSCSIENLNSFQKGMKNSNGKERKSKFSLNMKDLENIDHYQRSF